MRRPEGIDYVMLPLALVTAVAFAIVVAPFWALGRLIAWVSPNAFYYAGLGDKVEPTRDE